MLTIFSCPKPFRGHINIIQRNAIKSWTLLQPRPEIILIGDDEGTEEICKEFGLRHIPEVERNEYGTPLVSSVFRIGQSEATNRLVCYINTDIMLMSDFINSVKAINYKIPQQLFICVGRRWGIEVTDFWNFDDKDWEQKLREHVISKGKLGSIVSIDYFIFPRGLYEEIPPFALGRPRWDNWFIYATKAKRVPVIDMTSLSIVVHQNHDYSHIKEGAEIWLKRGLEAKKNLILRGGFFHMYTIWDSDLIATPKGLQKTSIIRHISAYLLRIKAFFTYMLTDTIYPYSYPLILLLKGVRGVLRIIALASKKIKFW